MNTHRIERRESGRKEGQMAPTTTMTNEVCAYCREWEGIVRGEKCRYNSRGHGEHRFDEIEMNADLASLMIRLNDLSGDPVPNFWHGFDVENVRLAEDDGEITMFVFSGPVARGIMDYRVTFSGGTPFTLIEATFAETSAAGSTR